MYFLRAMLAMLLLVAVSPSFAQQDDSVVQGVMKVRRAPVPSNYYVHLSYEYYSVRRSFFHFGRRDSSALQLRDGEFYPPQPVSIPQREDDTVKMLRDSTFLMEFYQKDDRPAGEYAWLNWLEQSKHYFMWSDTSGIDSCTFVYRVNTNGRVNISKGFDDGRDSSATRMQTTLWPYMRKLWLWYPAVHLVGDTGKQKKVSCIVTVKVYAVREDEPEKTPEQFRDEKEIPIR